ncbi:MAG: dicarboxylate/amino acid:cation symporter [Opitutales bacterium]|nr:dicarboxylate/amino acid:cation symporter [Opitutales bacterium]
MAQKKISLLLWNVAGFILGALAGILAKLIFGDDKDLFNTIISAISPFGSVLVAMLKTIVIPIVFFSLILGASSLPLKKFGRLGAKVILFYLTTSIFATLFGLFVASMFSPTVDNVSCATAPLMQQVDSMKTSMKSGTNMLVDLFLSAFVNPFQALAEARFFAIIVFAILFGLASRAVIESTKASEHEGIVKMLQVFDGIEKSIFKIVSWLLYYFPIGIFSLTFVNFAVYGADLFSSYAEIAMCVIVGIMLMIFVIYPAIIFITCRENPYKILAKIRAPIITAFVTRSSAATLPVSIETANDTLKVKPEISSFALSLGATINMDGVCLHLPVFVILSAGIFGLDITMSQMFLVVASVVLVSIGVGGVPGGSIFLLFMVLDVLHLSPEQTATIVALSLGINPLLDMFETACNVAGDNVGNYVVAKTSGMMLDDSDSPES